MSADGGAAQLVVNAEVLDAATWSPNGQQLVYATSVGDAPGLWVTTVADGATRRLPTRGPATEPGAVWVFDTTRREPPRRVSEFAAGLRLRGASWSADGSTLVVAQSERTTDIVLFER